MEDSSDDKNKIVLGITLDHEDGVYRAQRWLKGKVVVSVLDESVDIQGLALKLQFMGTEMAWHPRGFLFVDGGTSTRDKTVFEDERVLHEFDGTSKLVKGMVSYPFSIFLPKTCPPSMEYEEDSARGGGCAVRYQLVASLGTDYTTDRPVKIVGAPLSSKVYPYWLPPTCISARPHGGAVANACLVLCCGVENSHVGKGEKLVFSLSCRNFARDDLLRVDVFLTEEIHWMTPSSIGHHDKIHTHTLAIIRDVTIDGLVKEHDPTSRLRLWNADTPDEPTQVNNELRAEMTADVHANRNRVEMLIPTTARDSYDGHKLIRVHHFLKIVLVIRDRPNDPHVLIPIHIMDPPMGHARRASKNNLAESVTTVWPEDVPTLSDVEAESSATFPPTIEEATS